MPRLWLVLDQPHDISICIDDDILRYFVFYTASNVEISGIYLTRLVPALTDDDDIQYYTYKGSLTTPNCYESVRWIVFKKPINVTPYQV